MRYDLDTAVCLVGVVFAVFWLALWIGEMIWPMYLCPRPPEILRMITR